MLRITAFVGTALVLTACGTDSPDPTAGQAPSTAAGGAEQVPPAAIPATLGAATWLPADYAYLSSVQRLGSLLRDVRESSAVQSLTRLPMFAGMLREFGQQQRMLTQLCAREPLLDDLLTLAGEAKDREVFVACGGEAVAFATAATETFGAMLFAGMAAGVTGKVDDPLQAAVAAVLAHGDDLRLPPLVVGMRVSDTDRAHAFLDKLTSIVSRMPGNLTTTGSYQAWQLSPDDLPGWRQDLQRTLESAYVPAANQQAFLAWVAGQRLTISAGMCGDYLLFSLSDTVDHLARLGTGAPLASLPVFHRARERGRTPLMTTYVAPGLRTRGTFDVDAIVDLIDQAFPPAAPLAESNGTRQQFLGDLRKMMAEIGGELPTPTPYLSVTYRMQGLETLTIGGLGTGADSSRPLAILEHAGRSPLMAAASRAAPMLAGYKRLAHWTGVMFGHFEQLATPHMSPPERNDFDTFGRVVAPAVAELDDIMQSVLLPASEGGEGLILLDGTLDLRGLSAGSGSRSLLAPKPAMVFHVRDATQVVQACAQMHDVLARLVQRMASANGGTAPALPNAKSRRVHGGIQYFFELPDLPGNLQPCALVKGNTIVLASSLTHAQEVMIRQQRPSARIVDLAAPASHDVWIDIVAACDLLRTDANTILRGMAQSRSMPARQAQMTFQHLDVALQALSSIKSYSSRSWCEGNQDLQHSWLRVEGR